MPYSYHEDDDYYGDPYEDEPEYEDEWGCLYPERCLMPSMHLTSECYTAEHAEAYERYQNPRWWHAAWAWLRSIPYRFGLLWDLWLAQVRRRCVHCGRKMDRDVCGHCVDDLPF